MGENRIDPEKITHPFQLMAAWFVMLVLLVSALLAGAANISTPTWMSGFLAISSVVIALIVMVAVFLMLTCFRPHLQGPQEYAEWLKDERRYRGHKLSKISLNVMHDKVASDEVEMPEETQPDNFPFFKQLITHPVQVINISDSEEVVAALQRLGFRADIYSSREEKPNILNEPAQQAAVWIGSRIPPRVVLLALKTVLPIWPHLRYLHLSSDSSSPDYINDQIFIGGSTRTAKKYGLLPWTSQMIEAIPDSIDIKEFHALIRTRYAQQDRSSVHDKPRC